MPGSTGSSHGPTARFAPRLASSAIASAGVGFVLAAFFPGPGPRLVQDGAFLGALYLPPALFGALIVAVGVWAWRDATRRSSVMVGAIALLLLVGSASAGWQSISFRLSHPDDLAPFLADVVQLCGEVVAASVASAHLMTGNRHT